MQRRQVGQGHYALTNLWSDAHGCCELAAMNDSMSDRYQRRPLRRWQVVHESLNRFGMPAPRNFFRPITSVRIRIPIARNLASPIGGTAGNHFAISRIHDCDFQAT